jgi:choline monooxygenase
LKRPVIRKRDLAVRPIARAETIPSEWYTSPAFFELDRERVIARSWQYLGPSSGLDATGSYLSAGVAGNPLVVVRGNDGALRGFYNVCRHRGGPLVTDERGECRMLQCRYHGWTYTLEGMLRGVPRFDRVELFDAKDFGLVPVRIGEWEGMLFARLDRGGPALDASLAPVFGRIGRGALASKTFHRRDTWDIGCNWKVYVDNYLEGYHLPFVHPELCDLLDYGRYVTETFDGMSLQYSPFTGKETVYGSGDGEALYYFLFPNFMLNILPGRLQTNHVVPVAPDRCRVVFDYYFDEVAGDAARKRIEEDVAYSNRVQAEDIDICERVQAGLSSRAYDRGRFSVEMEQGVHHFQSLLRKAYRRAAGR